MKKVLALVLAVVMAFGMASVAFAAAPKITEALGVSGNEGPGNRTGSGNYIDLGEGDFADGELIIWVNDPTNYNYKVAADAPSKVTTAMLSSANITVKKSVSKGSELIDKVELKNDSAKGAYIKITFVEHFVSTSDKDFDFKVYLAVKGSKQAGTEVQITGTMKNTKIFVSDGDDYVNIQDGQVVEAEDYIKNIEVDLGNGVSIMTKMFEDKKYYGVATQDVTAADDAVVSKYPEIDTIYTLKTVNLKGSGNIVKFDIDDKYYVYNADGKYVGLSTEMLPYSDKYYLATKKIDMDATTEEPTEEPAESSDAPTTDVPANPSTGGDNAAPNANDNPGTGANGFMSVAVAAGVVALAAAGVVARKK